MRWLARNQKDIVYVVLLLALLGLVYMLPPDTSLKLVRESGALRVCVPSSYPPLVTLDEEKPGFDIELLGLIAEDLGLQLSVIRNSSMGRDFNPRNWRVTRAQCAVLAGGVTTSNQTRSFIDTTMSYLETGWALVSLGNQANLSNASVGFYAGISGLDRISLSRYLQNAGVQTTVITSMADLEAATKQRTYDYIVSESLLARQLALTYDLDMSKIEDFESVPLAFGIWKGDLTLKRAIQKSLAERSANGDIRALLQRYELIDTP